jgi:hypothetical protein
VTVSSGAEMSVDKSKSFTVLGAGLLIEGRGGARGVPPLQGEGAAPTSKGALSDGGALVVRGTFSLGDFEILGGGGGSGEGWVFEEGALVGGGGWGGMIVNEGTLVFEGARTDIENIVRLQANSLPPLTVHTSVHLIEAIFFDHSIPFYRSSLASL